MSELVAILTAGDAGLRDRSLDAFCRTATAEALQRECEALEKFRRASGNLYERVRALFFLYAIHRFHIPFKPGVGWSGRMPFASYEHLLWRRFEEAVELLLAEQRARGLDGSLSSALAMAYQRLGFQTLADQVRRSVRSVRGNQWMFRVGHPDDYPLRLRPELLERCGGADGAFPILHEATPVRMDLSHSGWSDIFFLGMDFPEGARVVNVSIDLSVRSAGSAPSPKPPVEAFLRVIDEPVLRLASVDLEASAEITSLDEVFDFAKDYLGLLKAAVIASGLMPPALEGSGQRLEALLARLTGRAGHGIEIVSRVNGIPKGSRLAVSTSLLACLIAVCMRATRQVRALTGELEEDDRRLIAARAILGEWLGGSGGGWQDSGGLWPGIKLIQGVRAAEGDPEYGISRGCLLPRHRLLGSGELADGVLERLQESLVLVHGGMAQDVGPILEMVTEKYLLRCEAEWEGRRQAIALLDEILGHLKAGDVRAVGGATQRNFFGPVQTIIPWAGNLYTHSLVEQVSREYGEDFWGFWMLGGMAGGGMGFVFDPVRKSSAQERLQTIMGETKRRLEKAVPFAMDPVVYEFGVNRRGSWAELNTGSEALMPPGYYVLSVPAMLRTDPRQLSRTRRGELDGFAAACRDNPEFSGLIGQLFERLLPRGEKQDGEPSQQLREVLAAHGFDPVQHEAIRSELRSGLIGLAQNRLAASTRIEDVAQRDVVDATGELPESWTRRGREALESGAVAVVSLAGGVGSRWTRGAGVVKALNPFARLGGRHRDFIEVHLAKSRRVSRQSGCWLPHVVTTSYLTQPAIEAHLDRCERYGYQGPLHLSPGRSVGLRLIPMVRDLQFAWEEMPQQLLDEQAQKVRDSLRGALIAWARRAGEASDYTDNLPLQCLHPVGHWYEVPNLLRNGVLAALLAERPGLKHLMVHNIDTLGADVSAALLGLHIERGAALTVEVIPRCLEDRGGGLARVDGHVRLVEGLALPHEEVEFDLSYYNSNTMWVDVDQLLGAFGLTRQQLGDTRMVAEAVRQLAARMPTYITLKDVKKRWGKGQEDIFPVAQFEKLWGDMTALPGLGCGFVVVPRVRGAQLKEPSQLDGWLRDGSAAYVESLCDWD